MALPHRTQPTLTMHQSERLIVNAKAVPHSENIHFILLAALEIRLR